MPAFRLERRSVQKPWGRRDVPAFFGPVPAEGDPLGEVWFPDPRGDDADLLVKYLFTSQKLSVQVHPGDVAARAAGYKRGKDEAWIVLAADPGATIGLGLTREVSREALCAAALDGSIEDLLDWRPVKPGDVLYSAAGTVHALGAGLVVVEIQQNLDLTYRLYDYGRPRELHLDEGIAVAEPGPWRGVSATVPNVRGRSRLTAGPAFVVERWQGATAEIGTDGEAPIWLVPLVGASRADGTAMEPGSVWVARGPTHLEVPGDTTLLSAYAGSAIRAVVTAAA
ncbi:class I mannose-6-phosphate isomerase [Sphingosinicella sp. CPCC 101087]|uniref:class I mannose-6-phosphate isomerase n=1 Tax=Sphingosinicella sp. CPCC 101087 TaxID=2497754 RepID=UPI00101DC621|nr:class I mannose-6-phosphate isomerase [Sphingosinicella sp. CPCC 101087]